MSYEVSATNRDVSTLLMRSIISTCGGSSAVANSLGIDRRTVHKWIMAGSVPRSHCYEVSKALQVSPWVLAYVHLAEYFGEGAEDLGMLVITSSIPEETKDYLMELYDADSKKDVRVQSGGGVKAKKAPSSRR